MVGKTVWVLDAWDDLTETSKVLVFSTHEKAVKAERALTKTPGRWHSGVVKRTVR